MLPTFHLPQERRQALARVAQGLSPADVIIRNARVVNVFTAEIMDHQDVAVFQGRIARVDHDQSALTGENTETIEADGQFLVPGLLDTHCHIFATRYSLPGFLRYAVSGGTTLIITETIELASILGIAGLRASLDALAGQPIKLLATIPPLAALASFMEESAPTLSEYRDLLQRPEVVGLGETYWANLLRDDGRLHEIIAATLEVGKTAEGHSAGARGARLQAYACEGISSCHEPITAAEGLERLRLGLHFMIRDGEIRQDLEAIAPIWNLPIDDRRMILVTDSVGPERLLEHGYIEHNVRRAIGLGLDPVRAIQMVTLNPAEHFHLDQHVGSIAPGRCADFLLTPDLAELKATWVMSDGRIVARDGALCVADGTFSWPESSRDTVHLAREVNASDLIMRGPRDGTLRARALEYVTGLVTREIDVLVNVEDRKATSTPDGFNKVVAIDRGRGTDERFIGLAGGYGVSSGAVATSMSWDSQAIIAIGANDTDMALAINRVVALRGGAVVCAGGAIIAEVATPVAGILSEAPMPELVYQLRAVRQALWDLGCPWPDPLLSADVLTTAAIPHFRMTDRGYARLKDGQMFQLWLD